MRIQDFGQERLGFPSKTEKFGEKLNILLDVIEHETFLACEICGLHLVSVSSFCWPVTLQATTQIVDSPSHATMQPCLGR